MRRCRFPRCAKPAVLARLPFSERSVSVCDRHRPWAFLVAMREVIA